MGRWLEQAAEKSKYACCVASCPKKSHIFPLTAVPLLNRQRCLFLKEALCHYGLFFSSCINLTPFLHGRPSFSTKSFKGNTNKFKSMTADFNDAY
jgi:hypothetical protein